jgi:hypothetical protein
MIIFFHIILLEIFPFNFKILKRNIIYFLSGGFFANINANDMPIRFLLLKECLSVSLIKKIEIC